MAIINLYTQVGEQYECETITHKSNAVDWLLKNIEAGQNFKVYEGDLSQESEISRDYERIYDATEVSVFIVPGTGIEVAYVVAAVLVVAALTIKPAALPNINRAQQSPNNSLTDRTNKARPNQRIVDVCGKVKSIPDVLSREYTRFVDNVEERIGYYCVARKGLLIEDIKEGDTLIEDIKGASAGVYGPDKSPNNSAPDIQIGDLINENVYSVTQSPDARGQTLNANNENTLKLASGSKAFKTGYITNLDGSDDFTQNFSVGDSVNLVNVKIQIDDGSGNVTTYPIGENTSIIVAIEAHKITFDITGDSSWSVIEPGTELIINSFEPKIEQIVNAVIGPFKMTSFKVDRLLFNVSALNGIYKENSNGRSKASVEYTVKYQKIDDNGDPIGVETTVSETLTGSNSSEKGNTTDIDLGAETFVQWSVERITPLDFSFDGTVIDEINLRSVFGLGNVNDSHFGDVTTIQTKRSNEFLTTATKTPELNCIATELVNKYEGGGVFNAVLTPNTQAMQSLIRLALDPFVGRRSASELDSDLLIAIQSECEIYFDNVSAGEFNYSFDSSSLSAQETFLSIGKAAFITLWREGRVLKGWFEKPQSIPSMVFTHRSKQLNSETWSRKRNSTESKDSIEFTYTDASTYTKETLFYPEDQSGTNPERVEFTGVKGIEQATWHMLRLFNKQKYQEITVDFGATAEGRFVKPQKLISVVKGSRVYTYDGYIVSVDGLLLTLSQDVVFTAGDAHTIILKNRDGSTESITVFETPKANVVNLLIPPTQGVYTGNNELKTEFSFGNEARLDGQLMLPVEIAPSGDSYVKIKAINYSPMYYTGDTIQTNKAFSLGFDDGFS